MQKKYKEKSSSHHGGLSWLDLFSFQLSAGLFPCPCLALCLRSRLSWFCSPSSAAGGFLLLPSLSPRVAQILCLRQVQGVGLRAEDAASCFAGSASIVWVSAPFTCRKFQGIASWLLLFLTGQDTSSSSPLLLCCWCLGSYRSLRRLRQVIYSMHT